METKFTTPQQDNLTIHNTSMIAMLLRWVPTLSPSLRSWLVSNVFELCTLAIHNRQLCCSVGILRVVVDVLSVSQRMEEYIGSRVEGLIFFEVFLLVNTCWLEWSCPLVRCQSVYNLWIMALNCGTLLGR